MLWVGRGSIYGQKFVFLGAKYSTQQLYNPNSVKELQLSYHFEDYLRKYVLFGILRKVPSRQLGEPQGADCSVYLVGGSPMTGSPMTVLGFPAMFLWVLQEVWVLGFGA